MLQQDARFRSRERHKATAVVVGNTWSLDITAVRPRDYIEESGMGGGREQLVHHYVLVAATVRCLHSSKMELVQAHAAVVHSTQASSVASATATA